MYLSQRGRVVCQIIGPGCALADVIDYYYYSLFPVSVRPGWGWRNVPARQSSARVGQQEGQRRPGVKPHTSHLTPHQVRGTVDGLGEG